MKNMTSYRNGWERPYNLSGHSHWWLFVLLLLMELLIIIA